MARRVRQGPAIGRWLRSARKEAGLTLQELAKTTGVSKSSLARFELDRAVPGFGDVCAIAKQLGWPLLYFATGKHRSGDDDRTLVTHLQFWGLRDVRIPEPVLIGEARSFEDLFAHLVSRPITQRVLAALPALLLRNDFDPNNLIASALRYGTLHRVGWLADVAKHVSRDVPAGVVQPDAQTELAVIAARAAQSLTEANFDVDEFDYFGTDPTASKSARARAWNASPPLTRRWHIACDISLEEFVGRAASFLGA